MLNQDRAKRARLWLLSVFWLWTSVNLCILSFVTGFTLYCFYHFDAILLLIFCFASFSVDLSFGTIKSVRYSNADAAASEKAYPKMYRRLKSIVAELLRQSGMQVKIALILLKDRAATSASLGSPMGITQQWLRYPIVQFRRLKESDIRVIVAHELAHCSQRSVAMKFSANIWRLALFCVAGFGLSLAFTMFSWDRGKFAENFEHWMLLGGAYFFGAALGRITERAASRADEHLADLYAAEMLASVSEIIQAMEKFFEADRKRFDANCYPLDLFRPKNRLVAALQRLAERFSDLILDLDRSHPPWPKRIAFLRLLV